MTSQMDTAAVRDEAPGQRPGTGASRRGVGAWTRAVMGSANFAAAWTTHRTWKPAVAIFVCAALAGLAGAETAVPTPTVLNFNPAVIDSAAGSPQQLTVSFAVTGITGNFAPAATLHYGIDYTAGNVSCTGAPASQTCTVPVSFQPTLPGGRKDALFLMNGSTRLATVLLGGIGQGPLSLIQPGVVANLTPGATFDNYGSAVDENGTVYVLTGDSVHSVTRNAMVTLMPITSTQQLNGIAIDGAGVLYISKNASPMSSLLTYDTVAGVQATAGFPEIPSPPCYWFESLIGAATDLRGDVFTVEKDNYCTNLFGLEPNGSTVTTAISPSIAQPASIAVDSSGDVFLGGDNTINEIVSGGGQSAVNNQGAEEGLAVDAAGTLYATRYSGGGVAELPASNYSAAMASLDGGEPLGLSLGSDGTLYVGNYTSLDKVDRSQGAINFGEQQLNTPATQSFFVYNGGNETLTIASIKFDTGDPEFTNQQASSCNNGSGGFVQLAPGQMCNYAVTMNASHAGTFSELVSVTTNSLYTAPTQFVALNGVVYGPYVTPLPGALNFGMVGLNAPSTLPVTLTNLGAYYNAELDPGNASLPAGYSIPPNACTQISPGGGSCVLNVTFDPTVQGSTPPNSFIVIPVGSSGGGGPWPSVRIGVTGVGSIVTLTPSTLTFTAPENGASAPQQLTLKNTGAAPVAISSIQPPLTSPVPFRVDSGACPATLSGGGGQCIINVTFDPPLVTGTATPPPTETLTGKVLVYDTDTATSPQSAQLTGISTPPLPVPLSIAEILHTTDLDVLTRATQLNVFEVLHTSDALTSLAPATQLTINEQLHLADALAPLAAPKVPTIAWPTPTPITYGTALGAAQLNASTGVAGTFAYNPPAGSVLGAGSQTLGVIFTPGDLVDYLPATASVTLTVNPAPLAVAANNISMTYGGSLPPLSYVVSGFVNRDTQASATTGAPLESTTATASSLPGAYPIAIAAGTLASANYTFAFVNGTLSILAPPPVSLSTSSKVTVSSGSGYTLTITVTNTGAGSVTGLTLATATLGSATGSPLPQTLGTLAPGASGTFTVNFPGSVGNNGAAVAEKYSGTCTGGSFSASVRSVTLP